MIQDPFTIRLHANTYQIKPYCEVDCTMYEVFTDCKKLFTLKMGADGTWKTHETDVVPIDNALIAEIGNTIMKQHTS